MIPTTSWTSIECKNAVIAHLAKCTSQMNHWTSTSTSKFSIGLKNEHRESSAGKETRKSRKCREKSRSTKSKCSPGLRSGKWTPEEEAYTNSIIRYFKLGLLDIEDGTSLRWYLAKKLNCEAMRVTKKLNGNSSIGKQIYRAALMSRENQARVEQAMKELEILEKLFKQSLSSNIKNSSNHRGFASSMKNCSMQDQIDLESDETMCDTLSVEQARAISPTKIARVSQRTSLEATRRALSDTENIQNDAGLLLYFCIKSRHNAVSGLNRKRLFVDMTTEQRKNIDYLDLCDLESHESLATRIAKNF